MAEGMGTITVDVHRIDTLETGGVLDGSLPKYSQENIDQKAVVDQTLSHAASYV